MEQAEKPKKVTCPWQEDKLGKISSGTFFGMAFGGLMTLANERLAKDLGCTPEKIEQYRRFMRYTVGKRLVRGVHGSVLAGVFGVTCISTFFGVHGWLVDKHQILDANNLAAAGAASFLAVSLVVPGRSVRFCMEAPVVGVVLGWTLLKSELEKQNQNEEMREDGKPKACKSS